MSREIEGFLFIGDPHLASRRPGRRTDADFGATVLGKIRHAVGIANEHRLLPVFLGDMFNRPKEDSDVLKTRLIRVLKECWTRPVSLVGNHDKSHARLGDGDSLAVIGESGVLDLIVEGGAFEEFDVGGVRVGLGGTPHGQRIPDDVTGFFSAEVRGVVWITHHDVAFDGAYPGAIMPFEIKGCRFVVNGHMHLTKPPVTVGATTWFNPGNILRQAIDAINHVPTVWAFSPRGLLTPHELPHERDVFDLTGRLVDPVSPGEGPTEDGGAAEESVFVDLMQAEVGTDMGKTHDGSILRREIEDKFEREGTDPAVRAVILGLLREVADAA